MPALPCTCQPHERDPVALGNSGRFGCARCGGGCDAPTFRDWSPNALAAALGWRVDLCRTGNGQRRTDLIRDDGRRFRLGMDSERRAHAVLSRVARMRGIDPAARPPHPPRALRDGREPYPLHVASGRRYRYSEIAPGVYNVEGGGPGGYASPDAIAALKGDSILWRAHGCPA